MPDALEICTQRLAEIRTARAIPDSRIQYRTLFQQFEPELLAFADSMVEEFGRKITVKIWCPLWK